MSEGQQPEAHEGPLTLAAAANILSKSLPDDEPGTGDQPEPQHEPTGEEPTGEEGAEPEYSDEGGEGSEPEPEPQPEPESEGADVEEFDFAQHSDRLVPVKINGKEEKVTLKEALAGYQRNRDYTQKTQAVAEQAKAYAAKSEEAVQKAAHYAEGLKAVEDVLAAALPQEPDWDAIRKADPAGYPTKFADHQRSMKKLEAVRAERQKVVADLAEQQQVALEAHVKAEFAKLATHYPEWKDGEKRAAHMTQITDFAKLAGYTPEEIAGIIDSRSVIILDKARKWDAHVARTKGAKQIVQKRMQSAPVLKPGSGKPAVQPQPKSKTKLDAAKSKFTKTRTLQDAADVLAQLIE
jgi:hypothetical protein